MASSLFVRLGLQSRDYVKGIKNAQNHTRNLKKRTETLGQSLKMLKKIAVISFAGWGVSRVAKSFIEAADAAEQTRIRLNILLGDVEKGNKLFEDMAKFASTVSFEYKDIMGSATALAGVMEEGNEEINRWLPLIADLAAASGLAIQDTTTQIIRMYSAGAASADLFRERGILAMLGFQAGVKHTAKETREMLIAAWLDPASKFRDASKELAKTWSGLLSMLSDKWFQFRNIVMEAGIFDALKSALEKINDELGKWIENNKELIAQKIPEYLDKLVGIINRLSTAYQKAAKSVAILQKILSFGAADLKITVEELEDIKRTLGIAPETVAPKIILPVPERPTAALPEAIIDSKKIASEIYLGYSLAFKKIDAVVMRQYLLNTKTATEKIIYLAHADAIRRVESDVMREFLQMDVDLAARISTNWPEVTKEIDNIMERITVGLGQAVNLIESVGRAWDAESAADRFLKILGDKIGGFWGGIIQLVRLVFQGIIADFIEMIPDMVFVIIKNFGKNIPRLFKNIIPGIFDAILKGIPYLIRGVAGSIPVIIEEFISFIPQIIGSIIAEVPKITKAIIDCVIAVFVWIATEVPKLIIKWWGQMIDGIAKWWERVKEGINVWWNEMRDGIDAWWNEMRDGIDAWWNDMVAGIAGWWDDMVAGITKISIADMFFPVSISKLLTGGGGGGGPLPQDPEKLPVWQPAPDLYYWLKKTGGLLDITEYPGPGNWHHGGRVKKIPGLSSDEVPAILQTGERVLSRQQNAAFESGAGRDIHIHLEIDGREISHVVFDSLEFDQDSIGKLRRAI